MLKTLIKHVIIDTYPPTHVRHRPRRFLHSPPHFIPQAYTNHVMHFSKCGFTSACLASPKGPLLETWGWMGAWGAWVGESGVFGYWVNWEDWEGSAWRGLGLGERRGGLGGGLRGWERGAARREGRCWGGGVAYHIQ